MPSELGKRIRERRKELGLGLREFARLVSKSPAFLTNLEIDDNPPSASEDTLREIAQKLTIDPYELITLAGKTPQDVAPDNAFEAALYRRVKALSDEKKQNLFDQLRDPHSE